MVSHSIRVARALEIAADYGGIDGGHHKAWLIDQMVRALVGCPIIDETHLTFGENPEYQEWVRVYQDGEDGALTYEWDTGIAP